MNQIDHTKISDLSTSQHESVSPDDVPTTIGRRRFIAGVGTAAGAAALATALPSGLAQAASLPSGASKFVPLPAPARAADSRNPSVGKWFRISSTTIRVPLHGNWGIPSSATAVVGTITSVHRGDGTVVTVFPSGGSVPEASNLNVPHNDMNANLATVLIGNGGIDIWTPFESDLIFDVLGYYDPVSGPVSDGRFVPLPDPVRAYDSREAPPHWGRIRSGETVTIDVSRWVPHDASAVSINLTTANTTGPTFLTVFPATETTVPDSSSLNVSPTEAMRASAVVCRVSNVNNTRKIKVYVEVEANVIVDVMGYFTGTDSPTDTTGLFVPSAPIRIIDTRDKGPNGRIWSNWKLEVEVPNDASVKGSSIVANVTMVKNYGPNLLKVTGARQSIPRNFSNVNAYADLMIVPNHVTSRITKLPERPGKSAIQVYTERPTQIVVDYAGYYVGTPASARFSKQPNPAPGGAPLEWTVRFNKPISELGNAQMPPTRDGDPINVTDSGYVWHWQGTGLVGEAAHVAVFAHRTETGNAPFKYLDQLGPGDTWEIDTADGRRYTYLYADRFLTDANTSNILAATRRIPGNTFSLIACTKGATGSDPWAPTSVQYRIIVTGVEVGWTAIW